MLPKLCIWMSCLAVFLCVFFSETCALAIYRDSDHLKNSRRLGARQLNDLFYDDDYLDPITPSRQSRWESAEWPDTPDDVTRKGDDDSFDDSGEEKPYNWFYYNKYITNGQHNKLYNGMPDNAGIGKSGKNPPNILPRPAPSFGRTSDMPKRFE